MIEASPSLSWMCVHRWSVAAILSFVSKLCQIIKVCASALTGVQENRCFWVAEEGGNIVGVAALHIGPDGAPCHPVHKDGMKADHAMVFRMSTKPSRRRQGVGSKLMVSHGQQTNPHSNFGLCWWMCCHECDYRSGIIQ